MLKHDISHSIRFASRFDCPSLISVPMTPGSCSRNQFYEFPKSICRRGVAKKVGVQNPRVVVETKCFTAEIGQVNDLSNVGVVTACGKLDNVPTTPDAAETEDPHSAALHAQVLHDKKLHPTP